MFNMWIRIKENGDEMNFVQDENHIIINANRETVK